MQKAGVCPSIAGRYVNQGELYVEGPACVQHPRGKSRDKAGWHCSVLLTSNLGVAGDDGTVVSLAQPDADTLAVEVTAEEGMRQNTHMLRRGIEFQCDADSLYFSDAKSMLGGPGITALGVLFLSGGAHVHSRAFVRNDVGELVMTVRQRMAMYHRLFGFAESTTNYVRWRPVPPAPESGRASP